MFSMYFDYNGKRAAILIIVAFLSKYANSLKCLNCKELLKHWYLYYELFLLLYNL